MVRGEARLVFRDINTGEITKEVKQKNTITESMLNRMANVGYFDTNTPSNDGRFGEYIFIGGLDQPTDRNWAAMYNPIERGRTEPGIQNPNLLSGNVGTGGTFAYYYQYQQRFDPPAALRTIYTIGIGMDYETSWPLPEPYRPVDVAAYLALTTPCTQSPTETLDIFYRIIWDNPEEDTSDTAPSRDQIYRIARRHIWVNSGYPNDYTIYPQTVRFVAHGRKMIPNVRNYYLTDFNRGYGSGDQRYPNSFGIGGIAYGDGSYRARIIRATGDLTQATGRLIGTILGCNQNYSGAEPSLFFNPLNRESNSPIQNIFSHSAVATGPFYFASTVPSGTGTLAINGDSWTNPDWQKFLRIEVTGSGGVGAGTYKVWMRNTTGFYNNTYQDMFVAVPFISKFSNYHGVMFNHGTDDNAGGFWQRLSYDRRTGVNTVPYDQTSKVIGFLSYLVIRYDLINNERDSWHSTSSVPLNVSDISQVCVADNGDIWVADAVTGLHRIHADGNTIDEFNNTHTDLTGITTSKCYGVTKTPGRIWAIMHDSLIWTDDNGTTFNVYDSGSSPAYNIVPAGQEYRQWFLQGDPTHADHRLAIVWNSDSNYQWRSYLRVTWWDSVSGVGNTTADYYRGDANTTLGYAYPSRRREMCQSFHCSPNDGVWGSRTVWETSPTSDDESSAIWNYNATTPTHVFASHSNENGRSCRQFWWGKDPNGLDAMVMGRYENSNQGRFTLGRQDGTHNFASLLNRETDINTVDGATNTGYMVGECAKVFFRDSGMFAGHQAIETTDSAWFVVPVTDSSSSDAGSFRGVAWKEYGWDGANWIEGHAGSKTMHATEEPIVDGLTVSFDDAGGTQTFVATDYYTVGVVDGVLVDGGVEFDSRFVGVYYKKVKFDQTDVEGGGLLPATTTTLARSLSETEQSVILDNNGRMTYNDPSNRFQGTSSGDYSGRLHGSLGTGRCVFRFRFIDIPGGQNMVAGLAAASKIGTGVSATNIDYAVRVTSVSNENWRVEVIQNGTVVHTEYDPTPDPGYQDGEFTRDNDNWIYYWFERPEGSTDLEVKIRNKVVYTFTGVSGELVPSVYSSHQSGYLYWNWMVKEYTDYIISLGDGVSTGRFEPNFWSIDYTLPGRPLPEDVKINGVPVTTILLNDTTTPLAAGEISLYTGGRIRFSPSDIGKTLTIDRYNVMLYD